MINHFNRDNLALFLCLTFSLIIYFSSTSHIITSVKTEISDFFYILKYPERWYSGLLSIEKDNKILNQKLVRLNMINSDLIRYQKENFELKKLLNFYKEQPFSLKMGEVVNSNFSYLMRTLTINLGKPDSITPNLPVIDINGLIGKTIAVGDRASQVQLINDKNFKISVRLGKDFSLGLFSPTHKSLGIVNGIIKTTNIKPGDIVYTSGVSTIYPKGIPVAKVISINKKNDKAFQDIVVEILSDLDNYNYIFVVL